MNPRHMVEFAIDEREKGEMINAKSIINFASIARFWDSSLEGMIFTTLLLIVVLIVEITHW